MKVFMSQKEQQKRLVEYKYIELNTKSRYKHTYKEKFTCKIRYGICSVPTPRPFNISIR